MKRYCKIKKTFILLITLIMVIIPIIKLFGSDGIFSWHIQQKEFYVSGIQCIIFVLLTYALSVLRRERASVIILGLSLLFMVMQGIIIPYLTVYIYFEIICFIGFCVNTRGTGKNDTIYNFITGLSVWGAFAIICSLLKIGTINDLRIMTIVLFFILFIFNKKKYQIMLVRFSNYIQQNKEYNLNLFLIIFLITMSLILAAKTNVGQDFDSIWYILKPEYMLVGENSFYDYLGYSAFVHYYPKLVEVFFLPISGLGDYSFILIGNVFIYNLFVLLGYKMVTTLCKECKEHIKLLLLLVIFTIPALTSVVPSAKGDVFGAFLVMAGLWFFIEFMKSKEIYKLVFSIISLFLCTGTKLTFLLWGGLVGVIISIYCLQWFIRNRKNIINKKINVYNSAFFISGMIFIFGIHYRTYRLTGYPIYPILIGFWNKLGFSGNYAMKTAYSTAGKIPLNEVPHRIYEFFFNPNSLSHTVMCWPTNIVLIFIIIVLILLFRKKIVTDTISKILIIISIFEMVFAVYYAMTKVQPDGNYFYLPFLVVCITCFYVLYLQRDMLKEIATHKFIVAVFALLLTLTIPLTFVTNWSWEVGIQPFSLEVIGDNFSDYKKDEEEFKEKGYYKIAKCIEEEYNDIRIIISGDEGRVKGAVESYWSAFSGKWASEEILHSYENFKTYVQYANIEGFVVLNDDESEFKEYVLKLISEVNCEKVLEDDNATFYIVSY